MCDLLLLEHIYLHAFSFFFFFWCKLCIIICSRGCLYFVCYISVFIASGIMELNRLSLSTLFALIDVVFVNFSGFKRRGHSSKRRGTSSSSSRKQSREEEEAWSVDRVKHKFIEFFESKKYDYLEPHPVIPQYDQAIMFPNDGLSLKLDICKYCISFCQLQTEI